MSDRDFLHTPELDEFEQRIQRGVNVPHQRRVAQPASHPLAVVFWCMCLLALAGLGYSAYSARSNQRRVVPVPILPLPSELVAHAGSVNAIAFSPDGTRLLTWSSDHTAILWNMKERRPERVLRGPDGQVTSVAYAHSGNVVATGAADGVIRIYRVPSGDLIGDFPDQGGYVESIAFSLDSKFLFSSFGDSVRMYDIQGNKLIKEVETPAGLVHALGVSKDNSMLAATSGPELCLYELPSLKLLARMRGHSLDVTTLAIAPDGRHIATGGDDKRVVLWDIPSRKPVATLRAHSGRIRVVAYDPRGDRLLTGGRDGIIITWSARDGKQLKTSDARNAIVSAIAISPDSQLTAIGGVEERVTLFQSSGSN